MATTKRDRSARSRKATPAAKSATRTETATETETAEETPQTRASAETEARAAGPKAGGAKDSGFGLADAKTVGANNSSGDEKRKKAAKKHEESRVGTVAEEPKSEADAKKRADAVAKWRKDNPTLQAKMSDEQIARRIEKPVELEPEIVIDRRTMVAYQPVVQPGGDKPLIEIQMGGATPGEHPPTDESALGKEEKVGTVKPREEGITDKKLALAETVEPDPIGVGRRGGLDTGT